MGIGAATVRMLAEQGATVAFCARSDDGVKQLSTGAAKTPNAALIDYAATKAAMVSIAKSLARKYGADGVLVNSVLPGLIRTPMWERAAGEIADAGDGDKEAVFAARSKNVALGR